MKNITGSFNALARRVFINPLSNFVMRQSEKISSIGYTGGNAILMIKDGMDVTLDSGAGASFLICSLSMSATKRWPVPAFRVIGGVLAFGSTLLCISALNLTTQDGVNAGKLIGGIAQIGIGGLLGFQKEIADYSFRLAQRPKNIFNRAVAGFTRYPVVCSAALDLVAGSGLMIGAIIHPDPGMQAAMTAWFLGVVGLVASDPRLQSLHQTMLPSPGLSPK